MEKKRLDFLLLELGLASTRTKAQELIVDEKVLVNGEVASKAGEKFSPEVQIVLLQQEHPYVSRGGVKLAAALDKFSIKIPGKVALDIGLSTGGFSDCLLRKGVRQIYGVDVGTAQLAGSLRENTRLKFWENMHIKDFRAELLDEKADLLVADLSFISLQKVIPLFRVFLNPNADLVLLVKPQFELGPDALNGRGIVRSPVLHGKAVLQVSKCCEENGYIVKEVIRSPILGGDGNAEYFLHAVLGSP